MQGERQGPRTALIVGATGVVGWTLLGRLAGREGWRTVAMSRREPSDCPADDFVAVDLLDKTAIESQRDRLADVTHVFITTRLSGACASEESQANLAALRNLVDVLESIATRLQHVCLVHGTKWYGSHLGPYTLPAREDHPRHMPPNFYHAQHDFVVERQAGKAWTWSTLRPHTVWGQNRGTGNSLVTGIGVYASISKALGLPLRFPGPPETYTKISQGVTATLLAEAMEWVSTTPECANETFNITNGDIFRWQELWPKIARLFEMEAGPVQHICLAEAMADKAEVWTELAARHDLQVNRIEELANWAYLDGLIAATWDDISSTIKAREYGFQRAQDSERAFLGLLEGLREQRRLP